MDRLTEVAQYCEDKLELIARQFRPGKKLTLLVRTPGKDTADFLLTTDDLDEVLKAVQRRKDAEDTTSPCTKTVL